jgi:hypothetical protein
MPDMRHALDILFLGDVNLMLIGDATDHGHNISVEPVTTSGYYQPVPINYCSHICFGPTDPTMILCLVPVYYIQHHQQTLSIYMNKCQGLPMSPCVQPLRLGVARTNQLLWPRMFRTSTQDYSVISPGSGFDYARVHG